MKHSIVKIDINDINLIKKIYRNGEENMGAVSENPFNVREDKKGYNTNIVSSETFFCDIRNEELVNVVKKYIKCNDASEYIANIHYINYLVGEEAKPHTDKLASLRTYIILLNDTFKGGDFYLKNEHIPFTMGEVLEFPGEEIHSVKPIEEGNREVLVVWVKLSQKNSKTLL